MRLAVSGATGGVGREVVGQALNAGHHATMPARWAPAGLVRPASGAPIALGAMSDAKITAAMSVFVVPSWSASR
jgi:uncharacterized protein YbjT (DUF2867 family)